MKKKKIKKRSELCFFFFSPLSTALSHPTWLSSKAAGCCSVAGSGDGARSGWAHHCLAAGGHLEGGWCRERLRIRGIGVVWFSLACCPV